LNERGNALLNAGRMDEAIKDFDAAIALDPKNDVALANRAIALAWKEDLPAATKSLDAAEGINPRNPVVHRARGLAAEQKGNDAAAVAAYSRSLELEPGNSFALVRRAHAFARLGDHDRAIADSSELLKSGGAFPELRLMRASLFVKRGRNDLAGEEAAALLAQPSTDGFSEVTAAAILTKVGKRSEAAAAYDRALAIKPSAFIYLNRARQRPKEEVDARLADLDAALKLEPDDFEALTMKADILADNGDWAGVADTLGGMTEKSEFGAYAMVERGVAFYKLKRPAEGEKEFKKAIAADASARTWNNLCWAKATRNVALETALSDCDQAVKLAPDNYAYRDSRAFALFRLGRVDEAIAEFDRALARAQSAASLIGRSAAFARKGDMARAKADRLAAEKIDPGIVEEYEGYGLTF
jgi:tetratricopeptide (TPR) repeat protein